MIRSHTHTQTLTLNNQFEALTSSDVSRGNLTFIYSCIGKGQIAKLWLLHCFSILKKSQC